MNRKKLIILCGLPASGKSSWADRYNKSHQNACWVSRDIIRYTFLKETDAYFAKEERVYKHFIYVIAYSLNHYDIVIADATHLNRWSRFKLIDSINSYIREHKLNIKYDLVGINFLTSLETCIERNSNRVGRENVPTHVIENMYKKFEPISNKIDKNFKLIINFEE